VIEREEFPRFHIGESLLPYSNKPLRFIGFEKVMQASDFTKKVGATFISEDGRASSRAVFSDPPENEETSTWQVRRADFDSALLQHAVESGAELQRGVATAVAFDEHGCDIEYTGADELLQTLRVGMVLDATGRFGLLARRLGLRRPDPELKRVAVFGHFRGVRRAAADAGDIVIVSRSDLGWFWFIPLDEETTSVGAVFELDERTDQAERDAGVWLARLIAQSPAAGELFADAELVGEARFEGHFSYSTSAYAGDRWLLLGDAGSFLDPVFSTGVHLALTSGLEAAEAANAALGWGSSLRTGPLVNYDRIQRRRYKFFRRLVLGFYDAGFRDLFFAEKPWKPGYDAVVCALAGNDRLTFGTALRLKAFYALVRLQHHFTLSPRLHARPGEVVKNGSVSTEELEAGLPHEAEV